MKASLDEKIGSFSKTEIENFIKGILISEFYFGTEFDERKWVTYKVDEASYFFKITFNFSRGTYNFENKDSESVNDYEFFEILKTQSLNVFVKYCFEVIKQINDFEFFERNEIEREFYEKD